MCTPNHHTHMWAISQTVAAKYDYTKKTIKKMSGTKRPRPNTFQMDINKYICTCKGQVSTYFWQCSVFEIEAFSLACLINVSKTGGKIGIDPLGLYENV